MLVLATLGVYCQMVMSYLEYFIFTNETATCILIKIKIAIYSIYRPVYGVIALTVVQYV